MGTSSTILFAPVSAADLAHPRGCASSVVTVPLISVVIVSYRCSALLRTCLDTVRAGIAPLDGEVIVVDNHSSDGTVEMVRQEYPWVTLIASEANLGFAAGNNLGLQRATGSYLAFLNPDTEASQGSLATLVRALEDDATVGLVAPRLVNPDGSLQPSVRTLPTTTAAALVLSKLHLLFSRTPAMRRYDQAGFDYQKTQDVQQPMGACLVTRRTVLDQVGWFDERFWMWFEEVDLCQRILAAGWKIRYVAEARVTHAMGVSSRQLHTVLRQRRYAMSFLAYFDKHHAGWRVSVLRGAAGIGLVASYGIQVARRLVRRDRSQHRLTARDVQ